MGSALLNLPVVPAVKTRAPASQDLINHFREEGWVAQARPRGRLVRIMVDETGYLTCDPHIRTEGRLGMMLRNILRPDHGWNAFLAIREQGTSCLWVIDCLMAADVPLGRLGVVERRKYLPLIRYPDVHTVPFLTSPTAFRNAIVAQHDILFRHPAMPGWSKDGMVLLTAPRP